MPDLLRISEAAALLGVSPRTLRRWDQSGKLRPVRHPVSGYRLYPRSQLTAFRLEEARVPTAAPALTPPRPGTAFIGRQAELDAIDAHLRAPGAALTLLGPPGVGKTRLALEVCARGRLRAGFVDLSACRSLEDLARAVALALAVPLPGGVAVEEAIARLGGPLSAGELELLVLDEVEQLVEPLRHALEVWRALAPALRLLLTSRRPLGAPWERRLLLAPLAVDAAEGRPEALALLLARVREHRHHHRPTDAELETLQAQARALEGLPLALELAAPALAEGRLLASGSLRGLEDALARSWTLLDPEEQQALVALSAFATPFTHAEALGVIGGPRAEAHLQALLRSSLVQREPGAEGPRLRLLSMVRQLAAARDPARRDRACARQAEALAAQVEGLLHPYLGARLPQELEALRRLHPALRAAFDDARRLGLAEDSAALGRGLLAADQLNGDTLALTAHLMEDARISARGRGLLLLQRSLIARRMLRNEQAVQDLERGLTLADQAADPSLRAYLATRLAGLLPPNDRADEARVLLAEAEALFREVGDTRGLAGVHRTRGELSMLADSGRGAIALLEQAAEGMREAGDLLGTTTLLVNLARVRAQRHAGHGPGPGLEALAAARRARAPTLEAFAQVTLGIGLHDQGEHVAARERFCTGAELYERLGVRLRATDARMRMAFLDLEVGDLARAEAQAARAAALAEGGPQRWRGMAERVRLAAQAPRGDPREILARVQALEGREGLDWSTRALDRMLTLLIHLSLRDRLPPEVPRVPQAEVAATLAELAPAAEGNQTLRCLTRLIQRAAAGQPAERALQLSADGVRFRMGAAPEQDLSRRKAPARLLAGLARARARTPGRVLEVEELVALGWPGERMRPGSAAQRVRTAIWTLRRLGLEEALETLDGGYRMAPGLRLVWAEQPIEPVRLRLDDALQQRLSARCAREGLSAEAAVEAALRAWLADDAG
ncbi:MAG: MerR family DNA-binding transcriptional regulator [Alphaproteobacteria bacterium]|nr:MerR family DNA-binding transcriptional regulator [Alphaproteobacteria bacterium]